MTHKHLGLALLAVGVYSVFGPSLLAANYKPLPVWSSVESSFSIADYVAIGAGAYLYFR